MNLKIPFIVGFTSLIFFGYLYFQWLGTSKIDFINKPLILCLTTPSEDELLPVDHPRYLEAGKTSGLHMIIPNDNLIPAGIKKGELLEINLEVKWGDFRMETPNRPGVKLIAVGEIGKQASIPSPLVRIPEGSRVLAKVTNTLKDSTITVYGFQKRPYAVSDSLFILPGETKETLFDVGKVGTYLYRVKIGAGRTGIFGNGEDDQLAGAFVVDPKEGVIEDRILVMNIFSNYNDKKETDHNLVESLTINGRSWPYTERFTPEVGDTITWKVINASNRVHPMHLHGFYYDVMERGNMRKSKIYSKEERSSVVTETLRPRNTMTMQWVPERPGNWLFHCHLSFHVTSEIRLPGAEAFDPKGAHQHMAGLVIGIQVEDGDSDLISKGESKKITLYTTEGKKDNLAIKLENEEPVDLFKPGPALILKQYQTTHITLKNRMSIPTSIHWHGLEIDSWSDGVPNWSASDGKSSPIIEPGHDFTYKLSLMRPGTFVYHSHLDDVFQLTKALYGVLIVLGENEVYNPEIDHSYIMGWKTPNANKAEDVDLNGWGEDIPIQKSKIGQTHRLRMINIGPAGNTRINITKNDSIFPIKRIAKDGAELPILQQNYIEESSRLFVGETADYSFTPTVSGIYELNFKYLKARWKQTWIVE